MTGSAPTSRKWFHRPVPIWVTEYGEQTKPAVPPTAVSYAEQAADAKQALKLAAANPYVQMFVWFIFRDSTAADLVQRRSRRRTASKKPAYAAFKTTAAGMVGQTQVVSPGQDVLGRSAGPDP